MDWLTEDVLQNIISVINMVGLLVISITHRNKE
jgi:hypothetical protein